MADLPEGALPLNLVAIDIARYSNAVLIESSDGKRQRFRMTDNASDFDRLLSYLQALPGNCRVALESTGDYHRPLAHRLLTAGHEVVSINFVAQARHLPKVRTTFDTIVSLVGQAVAAFNRCLRYLRQSAHMYWYCSQNAGGL